MKATTRRQSYGLKMSDYKWIETQRLGNGKPGNVIFNISVLGSGTLPSTMSLKKTLTNSLSAALENPPDLLSVETIY